MTGARKLPRPRAVLLCLLALGLLAIAAACTKFPGAAAPAGDVVQTSDEGQVKVAVTRQAEAAAPTFTVALDTHSVELDGYDLRQLAVLRTDQGREVRPSGWDAPKGGHHRSGALTFPAMASDGSPLVGPTTRELTLVIRDVAGVPERVFRWPL